MGQCLYFASSDEKDIIKTSKRLATILKENAPEGVHWTYKEMPEEKHSTINHSAAFKTFREVFKPTMGFVLLFMETRNLGRLHLIG